APRAGARADRRHRLRPARAPARGVPRSEVVGARVRERGAPDRPRRRTDRARIRHRRVAAQLGRLRARGAPVPARRRPPAHAAHRPPDIGRVAGGLRAARRRRGARGVPARRLRSRVRDRRARRRRTRRRSARLAPLSASLAQDTRMALPMPPAVELVDVRKAFGERTILAGVSMRVERGERVALRGESGSGKATLLNLIAGLEPADAGSVRVAGVTVSSLDADRAATWRRAAIGFVFQAFHLLPHLDAARNVAVPLLLNGLGADEALERATAMLARGGLGARAHAWPRGLSGGERQRRPPAPRVVPVP